MCCAQARFEAAGYKLPQVVFWNLAASRIDGRKSTPMQFNEAGVALVSGFSGQLLKLFMDKPGNLEAWKASARDLHSQMTLHLKMYLPHANECRSLSRCIAAV